MQIRFLGVREGLEQTPPRGSVTTTLLVHGTILVRQALKKTGPSPRWPFEWQVTAPPVLYLYVCK